MKAKYETRCPVCATAIKVGEHMGRANNQWAHENCALDLERRRAAKHRLMR